MRTTLILALLLICVTTAAVPTALAEHDATQTGQEDGGGPVCWRVDPTAIPPVLVWLCPTPQP